MWNFYIGWSEDQAGNNPGLFPHSIVQVFPAHRARPPKYYVLIIKAAWGMSRGFSWKISVYS
jgi:hypothetical protein